MHVFFKSKVNKLCDNVSVVLCGDTSFANYFELACIGLQIVSVKIKTLL